MFGKRSLKYAAAACVAVVAVPLGIDLFSVPGGGRFETAPAPLKRADASLWELTDEFSFIDSAGKRWTAPQGTRTDGASIPWTLHTLIGTPFDATHLDAAVVHDAYCGVWNEGRPPHNTEDWESVHRMFYEACLASGTGVRKAKVMYAAVYLAGPRWDDPERELAGVPEEALREEFEKCRRWIETNDPPVGRIDEWMREHEAVLRTAAEASREASKGAAI